MDVQMDFIPQSIFYRFPPFRGHWAIYSMATPKWILDCGSKPKERTCKHKNCAQYANMQSAQEDPWPKGF